MSAGELLGWVAAIALSIVIVVIAFTLVVSMLHNLRNLRKPIRYSEKALNIMKGPNR